MSRLTRFEPKYNCYIYTRGYSMSRKAKQKLGKIEDILEEYGITTVKELKDFLEDCDFVLTEYINKHNSLVRRK